jgi:hypothetical protein
MSVVWYCEVNCAVASKLNILIPIERLVSGRNLSTYLDSTYARAVLFLAITITAQFQRFHRMELSQQTLISDSSNGSVRPHYPTVNETTRRFNLVVPAPWSHYALTHANMALDVDVQV